MPIAQAATKGGQLLMKGLGRLKGAPAATLDMSQAALLTGARAKNLPGAFKRNPLMMGAFTAGGAAFTYDEVIEPMATAEAPMSIREAIEFDRRARRDTEIERIKFAQKRQKSMESLARLAALDPQLYNELVAGRRLPQGAMTFGGTPRVDLLEQLASEMAEGNIQPTPNPDDELAQLLGA